MDAAQVRSGDHVTTGAVYGGGMTYVAAEARQELLDAVAGAVDAIARALSDLGAAYDLLDEQTADRLEEELFRPIQLAYGRAQRTHAGFAERHGLRGRAFTPAREPAANRQARDLVADAVEEAARADDAIAELQDSLRPVEVGDAELRAGLAEVRELVGGLRARARELLRVLGR